MKINLHSHTNYSSDGVLTVSEIIKLANDSELAVFSVTDHNSVLAYYEPAINDFNGRLITGVELCVMVGDKSLDITCYNFDLDQVNEWLGKNYKTSFEIQQTIYQQLLTICRENGIKLDDNIAFKPRDFAHRVIYDHLKDNSFFEEYDIKTGDDFYRVSTTNEAFPLYVNMDKIWPDINDAIKIIKATGGIVFWAHPYDYVGLEVDEVFATIQHLIDGIEVMNAKNNDAQTSHLMKLAQDNNLLTSVGTDFHGTVGRDKFYQEIDDKTAKTVSKWFTQKAKNACIK